MRTVTHAAAGIAVVLARAVDVRVVIECCADVYQRARECLTSVRISACHTDMLARSCCADVRVHVRVMCSSACACHALQPVQPRWRESASISVVLARAVDLRVRACVCRANARVQVCDTLLTCACVLARARGCVTGVRVSACHTDVLARSCCDDVRVRAWCVRVSR